MKESERFKPIRPFTREDIPRVADLYSRFLMNPTTPSRRYLPREQFAAFVEHSIFQNPCLDEEIPSLVAVDPQGNVIGFLACISRRMLLRGEPVRMAVSFNFIVDRESRSSLAALQLLKTFFAGPQDFAFTDSSGDIGRRVWVGAGGGTALLHSLCWTRLLSPSQFAVNLVGRRLPATRLADNLFARLAPGFLPGANPDVAGSEMTTQEFLAHVPQLIKGAALHPVYDERIANWLFEELGQLKYHGSLQKVLVRNRAGEVLGSYIYHLNPGGESAVLQIAARPQTIGEVLDHLFDHARQGGSVSLIGKVDPPFLKELTEKNCHFRHEGVWTLMHSRNPDLLKLIHQGDAFLSKLEGDLPVQF